MMNFTQTELLLRDRLAEHERETQTLMRARGLRDAPKPHRLRAAIASKLARLAVRIDRETASALVRREVRTAGRG